MSKQRFEFNSIDMDELMELLGSREPGSHPQGHMPLPLHLLKLRQVIGDKGNASSSIPAKSRSSTKGGGQVVAKPTYRERPRWIPSAVGFTIALVLAVLVVVILTRIPSPVPNSTAQPHPEVVETPKDPEQPRQREKKSPSDILVKKPPPPRKVDPDVIVVEPPPEDPNQRDPKQPKTVFANYIRVKKTLDDINRKYEGKQLYPSNDPEIIGIMPQIDEIEQNLSPRELREVGNFFNRVRSPDETLGMLVPAYFDPVTPVGLNQWNWLFETAQAKPLRIIAIANPAFGPGEDATQPYQKVIDSSSRDENKKMYIRVVGFIECNLKTPKEISDDVETWVSLYPKIRGFYFHSHRATREESDEYEEIFALARRRIRGQMATKEPIIISNPVGKWDEKFYDVTKPDILSFDIETPSGDRLPLWSKRHPSIKLAAFARITNPKDVDAMKECMQSALASHLSWFWVGPEVGRSRPDCFEEEVDEFLRLNALIKSNKFRE